jgi:S1-C subfamily serine protease
MGSAAADEREQEMNARLPLWLLGGLLVFSTGCAHIGRAKTGGRELGDGPVCQASNPLMELYTALTMPTFYGASSELDGLVELDNELGFLHIAQARLKTIAGPESVALQRKTDRLTAALEKRRSMLGKAAQDVRDSHTKAESALEVAAHCEGIDLRDPAKPATTDELDDTKDAESNAKTEKANRKRLASKACQPTLRLWATARRADLTKDVSSTSVAAQLTEFTLDEERSEQRDALVAALREHGENLLQYRRLASPKIRERDDEARAITELRSALVEELEGVRRRCFTTMLASSRIVGGKPSPRRVTVVVRPTWSGPLESVSRGVSAGFGSGFVVRWRTADGQVETRIVTNKHVLAGAFEAVILPGDASLLGHTSSDEDDEDKGWKAELVYADPLTDIAILRFREEPKGMFEEGLSFRLEPAAEQETVVAAGFPGVGVQPSFQVSEGSVSNAKFGADDEDGDPALALVQHTAPIDPGNSGGPLLDKRGRLLGMNTFKIVGRENVALAIPTAKIQQVFIRSEEPVVFDASHAKASCNAVLGALSAEAPTGYSMTRFGLALFEASKQQQLSTLAVESRDRVERVIGGPVQEARIRAFASMRAKLDEEGGVQPFEVCTNVRPQASSPGAYEGTIRTRDGVEHKLVLAEEHGALRLVSVE